jgi:hypothetical protein
LLHSPELKGNKIMVRRMAVIVFIGIFLGVTAVLAANSEREKATIASAENWLKIVDAGEYIESWKQSSENFRQRITQDQWEQAMSRVRSPLGKLVSRKMDDAFYTTSLPGVPDGQYVVIEFNTSFENKKSGYETVSLTLDKDGKWRVTAYSII